MDKIRSLKYIILNEWTYDPPAGECTFYHDQIFYDLAEIKPMIDEIVSNMKDAIGYEESDEINMEDDGFPSETEGLDPSDEDGSLSTENIKGWSWDNGGAGCGCVLYAEGSDIVESVIGFYRNTFEDLDDFNLDQVVIEEVINAAKNNPNDFETVMKLLHTISALIEKLNYSVW